MKEKAIATSEIITLMNSGSFVNSYLQFKTRCPSLGNAMKNPVNDQCQKFRSQKEVM